MRTTVLSLAVALVFGAALSSFTSKEDAHQAKSTISWVGKKVTGQHTGTINFKEVNWKFDRSGALQSGDFVVDMTTITVTDLEGEMKGNLEGHLASADFFGVEKFPTSSFTTTAVKSLGRGSYEVTGDLTIKDITHPLTFTAQIEGTHDGKHHATAEVVVDRAKYDIQYGSGSFFKGLGDKMIYDEFTLNVEIAK